MDYENLNFNFILTGEIWTGRTFKINNPGRDRILKAKKKCQMGYLTVLRGAVQKKLTFLADMPLRPLAHPPMP